MPLVNPFRSEAAGHRFLTHALVGGLSIVSGVATATGLYAFMAHNAEVGPVGSACLAALLTLLIIGGMLKSLREIAVTVGITRVIYAVVLLVLLTNSVGFGFGFYWRAFRGADVGQAIYAANRFQVIDQISRVREQVRTINGRLAALADYSRSARETEASIGGTCSPGMGNDPRRGAGPVFRLRSHDATVFATQSGEFKTIAARLDAVLAELLALTSLQNAGSAAAAAERLNLKVIESNGLIATLPLDRLSRLLDERISQGRRLIADPVEGPFACADAKLDELLAMVRGSLKLATVAPVVIPETSGHDGVYFAIARLFNSAVFLLPGTKKSEDDSGRRIDASHLVGEGNRLERSDIVPALLALTIDLLITLLSLARRRTPFVEECDEVDCLPILPGGRIGQLWMALAATDRSILSTLAPFLIYEFGRPMAAVPLVGATEAQVVLAFMELLRDSKDVVLETRPHWWIRRHLCRTRSAYHSADAFLVFAFRDGVLVRLIRQSMHEALEAAGLAPPAGNLTRAALPRPTDATRPTLLFKEQPAP